jgi:hypothetical protein
MDKGKVHYLIDLKDQNIWAGQVNKGEDVTLDKAPTEFIAKYLNGTGMMKRKTTGKRQLVETPTTAKIEESASSQAGSSQPTFNIIMPSNIAALSQPQHITSSTTLGSSYARPLDIRSSPLRASTNQTKPLDKLRTFLLRKEGDQVRRKAIITTIQMCESQLIQVDQIKGLDPKVLTDLGCLYGIVLHVQEQISSFKAYWKEEQAMLKEEARSKAEADAQILLDIANQETALDDHYWSE